MDVIGYQGAVLGLVLADEPVLHAVIDEKSRPAGADIQEPVRCLVPVSYTHLDVYKRQSLTVRNTT